MTGHDCCTPQTWLLDPHQGCEGAPLNRRATGCWASRFSGCAKAASDWLVRVLELHLDASSAVSQLGGLLTLGLLAHCPNHAKDLANRCGA